VSLEELRAFLQVVDEGSFLSAATALGISRTTLRRQVDALEARIGLRLIERNSKGVVLTDAGTKLALGGRAMEDEFGALLDAIRETERRPSGEVRLHLPTGLPPAALASVYGLVHASWPHVRLRVAFSDAPQLAKLAAVDMVVWFGDLAPSGAWETRTILQTRQRLFADRSYLDARGTPTTLAELGGHDVLAWIAPGETSPQLVTTRGTTMPLAGSIELMNVHVIHECAQLGLGIAWAPDGGLPATPGRAPLVPLLEHLAGRDVPLSMGVRRAIAQTPKMRVFLENFDRMRALVFTGA
jgi:DNA-binding transcriptional LysR family regulator